MATEPKPFSRSSKKTYSLAEVVEAPRTMVDKGPDNTVFAFPVVALMELLLLLGITVVILGFSLVKDAPLEELANPLVTTDPAKAPWYFMGLQEMLEHMHPLLAGIIVPGISVLYLMLLPYIDSDRTGAGRWFTNARGQKITLWTMLYGFVSITTAILLDDHFPPREIFRDSLPPLVTQSLMPLVGLIVIVLIPVIVLMVKTPGRRPNTREVSLVLVTMMAVAAVILTVIGFVFRGPGFELFAPWNMPNGYNPFDHL